jgi:hypothetical protein
MATYTEYLNKIQEDVLTSIKEAQDASLKSLSSFGEIAAKYPATAPAMPKFEGFPTPAEVIEQSFDFAQKFIDLRKEYTLKVAEMIASAQATVEPTRKSGKHN